MRVRIYFYHGHLFPGYKLGIILALMTYVYYLYLLSLLIVSCYH